MTGLSAVVLSVAGVPATVVPSRFPCAAHVPLPPR